eukprot:TRINITY_DN18306_c0_g1_i1.p1 TRINITY_DN18306_c0_g1~~TRINITY_DN18306_c0_g1_i1.p1  ORF type:complete len:228 (+),score=25.80 TRINITY_DN18306_c0_g1_i1:23-706(+)
MSMSRPADMEAGSYPGNADLFIPRIRHTFLDFPPEPSPKPRRSKSAHEQSTCDRYAREVHALMFKVQPLPNCSREEAPREDSPYDDHSPAPSTLASPRPSTSLASQSSSSTTSFTRQKSDLSDLPDEALSSIPVDEDGQLTSVGSQLHYEGDCRPCAFLRNSRRPCTNGIACMYCHFDHGVRRRVKLGRKRRLDLRIKAQSALEDARGGLAPPPRHVPISWSLATAF